MDEPSRIVTPRKWRRYGRLSKSAERAIAEHRVASTARQHSTEAADCERVERGIADCYRFAGREPPKRIIWVDSPAALVAGPVAATIMEYWARGEFDPKRGRVGESIEEFARSYLSSWVSNSTIDIIKAAVGSEVDPTAYAANLTISLREACSVAVTDAIRAATKHCIYCRLFNASPRDTGDPGAGAAASVIRRAMKNAGNTKHPFQFAPVRHRIWLHVLFGRARGPDEVDMWATAFVRDVVGPAALSVSGEMWQRSRAFEAMQSAGPLWPHPRFCIVAHPPVELHVALDPELSVKKWELHNPEGPAVVWRDGSARWYLRNWLVDSESAPPDLLTSRRTVDRITASRDAVKRSIFVWFYGRDRYVRDAGAVRIDAEFAAAGHEKAPPRDIRYRALWRVDQRYAEPMVVVDVINQSPEPIGTTADGETSFEIAGRVWRRYMLRVPPTITTCAEAVAWTFGRTAETYRPEHES